MNADPDSEHQLPLTHPTIPDEFPCSAPSRLRDSDTATANWASPQASRRRKPALACRFLRAPCALRPLAGRLPCGARERGLRAAWHVTQAAMRTTIYVIRSDELRPRRVPRAGGYRELRRLGEQPSPRMEERVGENPQAQGPRVSCAVACAWGPVRHEELLRSPGHFVAVGARTFEPENCDSRSRPSTPRLDASPPEPEGCCPTSGTTIAVLPNFKELNGRSRAGRRGIVQIL